MGKKSIKINMIMSILLSVTSLIFPLITYPYASRILGTVGIGKVNFATGIVSYFIGFSQLGIPIYGVRACAKVRDNKEKLSNTVKELLYISFFLTVLSYFLLGGCFYFIEKLRDERPLYLIISSTILFQTIGIEWYYKAIEEYSYITIRSLVCKVVAVVALFFLVRVKEDYCYYGLVSVMASGLSSIFNFLHARKMIFAKSSLKLEMKKHMKPIFVIYAMSLASSVYSNLDTVMVGFMKGDESVGIYTTSIKIKTILIGIITAGAAVLLPRVSYYLENRQFEKYRETCKKTFRFIVITSLPLTVYFSIFSQECIQILAGKDFLTAWSPMIIMMPTVLIIGLTYNMGMEMLISAGKEMAVLYAAVGGAITDLAINLILIPKYDAAGAAIGTLVAEIVVFVIELYFLNKVEFMKGTLGGLPWVKTLFSVGTSTACAVWIKMFELPEWAILLLSMFVFGMVYFVLEFLLKEPIIVEILYTIKYKVRKRGDIRGNN